MYNPICAKLSRHTYFPMYGIYFAHVYIYNKNVQTVLANAKNIVSILHIPQK